jgi:hypothetical protein
MLSDEIPVYISLTSIYNTQGYLFNTLQTVLTQSRKPDKIFLYLSEEPYILDDGFKNKEITHTGLVELLHNNSLIDVRWVKNIGSFRKLLPLLKEKWEEDCFIITIDDDTLYHEDLIFNLLNDYNKYKCVIGYRGFTPHVKNIQHFDYSMRGPVKRLNLHNFLMGKGGILYKPQFFHNTGNLIFNDELYLKICNKQDDVWFYTVRILNKVECFVGTKTWETKPCSSNGLFDHFNIYGNMNTTVFRKLFRRLSDMGYTF